MIDQTPPRTVVPKIVGGPLRSYVGPDLWERDPKVLVERELFFRKGLYLSVRATCPERLRVTPTKTPRQGHSQSSRSGSPLSTLVVGTRV